MEGVGVLLISGPSPTTREYALIDEVPSHIQPEFLKAASRLIGIEGAEVQGYPPSRPGLVLQ